jgi:hypothetical protein
MGPPARKVSRALKFSGCAAARDAIAAGSPSGPADPPKSPSTLSGPPVMLLPRHENERAPVARWNHRLPRGAGSPRRKEGDGRVVPERLAPSPGPGGTSSTLDRPRAAAPCCEPARGRSRVPSWSSVADSIGGSWPDPSEPARPLVRAAQAPSPASRSRRRRSRSSPPLDRPGRRERRRAAEPPGSVPQIQRIGWPESGVLGHRGDGGLERVLEANPSCWPVLPPPGRQRQELPARRGGDLDIHLAVRSSLRTSSAGTDLPAAISASACRSEAWSPARSSSPRS